MSLPRILIIDDQYGWDNALRSKLKKEAGLLDGAGVSAINAVAEAVFCPGQVKTDGTVKNDYDIICASVKDTALGVDWALVLLDVRFDSGVINEGGVPSGQADDDKFGEIVRDRLKHDFPDLQLVMFSSKGESDIEISKTPYLSKEGLKKRELTESLLNHGKLTNEQARSLLKLGDDVIAASSAMLDVYRKAFSYSETDESVLILGESGSGKEKVARYIHQMSPRHDGPFITINVAAIPDNLLENELFGVIANFPGFHNKVAKVGLFEMANNGTLFLDEIGDMSPSSQAKILRALQEKTIVRLGGTEPIKLNIRVLSATARNLTQKIEKGEFLNDLLHRIGTLPINIPPLREHPEDIVPLADALLQKCSREQKKKGISLSKEAKLMLAKYPFDKNNVRELENVIKLLVSMTGNHRVVSSQDISAVIGQLKTASIAVTKEQSSIEPALEKPTVSEAPTVTLQTLAEVMNNLSVDKDDPALRGAKNRLEHAFHELFHELMKRLAGAALERCCNSV